MASRSRYASLRAPLLAALVIASALLAVSPEEEANWPLAHSPGTSYHTR